MQHLYLTLRIEIPDCTDLIKTVSNTNSTTTTTSSNDVNKRIFTWDDININDQYQDDSFYELFTIR